MRLIVEETVHTADLKDDGKRVRPRKFARGKRLGSYTYMSDAELNKKQNRLRTRLRKKFELDETDDPLARSYDLGYLLDEDDPVT